MGSPVAVFPGAIAGDKQLRVANNNIQTTLALPILGSSDTTFTVTNAAGILPNMIVTIDNEKIAVWNVVGNVITVGYTSSGNVDGRAFDGTTAVAHASGATVALNIDAWHHNAMKEEVKAIETALGANLANIPTSPLISAKAYNFTPQTPGGSLIIGSNTITLNPMPPGITASSIGTAYLYISGGAGAAEAVLITGVLGSTVTFPCANTHSGAWTIRSASGGIQEAVSSVTPAGVGQVYLVAGIYTLYAPVSFPTGNYSIRGEGREVTTVRMDVSASAVNAFNINSSVFSASGFRVDFNGNQAGPWSTGDGFNFTVVGVIYHLTDLEIFSWAKAVESIGQHGYTSIVDVNLSGHDYGLKLRGGGGQYLNINVSVASGGVGIDISPTQADRAVSGMMWNNIWIGGGATGFRASSAIAAVNEVFIGNLYIDTTTSIDFYLVAGAFTIANWRVAVFDFLGASVGIEIDSTGGVGNIANIRFELGQVSAINNALVAWAARNLSFGNVSFRMTADGTASSVGIDLHGGNTQPLSLINCSVGYGEGGGVTGARPVTGIYMGSGAADGLIIVGTPVLATTTALDVSLNPSFTRTAILACPGLNEVTAAVNYIATESGANNAIVGALQGVTLAAGLRVVVKLAHTLQAGANTFNLNAGGAVNIKSSRNTANNIGTAYAATGTITLLYDGTQWVDVSQ